MSTKKNFQAVLDECIRIANEQFAAAMVELKGYYPVSAHAAFKEAIEAGMAPVLSLNRLPDTGEPPKPIMIEKTKRTVCVKPEHSIDSYGEVSGGIEPHFATSYHRRIRATRFPDIDMDPVDHRCAHDEDGGPCVCDVPHLDVTNADARFRMFAPPTQLVPSRNVILADLTTDPMEAAAQAIKKEWNPCAEIEVGAMVMPATHDAGRQQHLEAKQLKADKENRAALRYDLERLRTGHTYIVQGIRGGGGPRAFYFESAGPGIVWYLKPDLTRTGVRADADKMWTDLQRLCWAPYEIEEYKP
jgi:hypothetical protein